MDRRDHMAKLLANFAAGLRCCKPPNEALRAQISAAQYQVTNAITPEADDGFLEPPECDDGFTEAA
jgi:hypothetical protein